MDSNTPTSTGPDYSMVDSRQKALARAVRGDLVPLQLLPAIFGGDDSAENLVFVPSFAADLKNRTDENVIAPLAREGKFTRYRATPEYWGNSFVPIAIRIVAEDPGSFAYDLAIWGEALERGDS